MKAVRSASLPAATFPPLHAQTPYANSITLLANYERAAGNSGYSSAFSSTFANARNTHVNFQNNSYDDTAWWGLARIDALQYLRHLGIGLEHVRHLGLPGQLERWRLQVLRGPAIMESQCFSYSVGVPEDGLFAAEYPAPTSPVN